MLSLPIGGRRPPLSPLGKRPAPLMRGVFVGTYQHGVFRLETPTPPYTWAGVDNGDFTPYGLYQYDIHVDSQQHRVYAATGDGIWRWDEGSGWSQQISAAAIAAAVPMGSWDPAFLWCGSLTFSEDNPGWCWATYTSIDRRNPAPYWFYYGTIHSRDYWSTIQWVQNIGAYSGGARDYYWGIPGLDVGQHSSGLYLLMSVSRGWAGVPRERCDVYRSIDGGAAWLWRWGISPNSSIYGRDTHVYISPADLNDDIGYASINMQGVSAVVWTQDHGNTFNQIGVNVATDIEGCPYITGPDDDPFRIETNDRWYAPRHLCTWTAAALNSTWIVQDADMKGFRHYIRTRNPDGSPFDAIIPTNFVGPSPFVVLHRGGVDYDDWTGNLGALSATAAFCIDVGVI